MRYVENCLDCGDPATIMSGHVHIGGEHIVAGRCKSCDALRFPVPIRSQIYGEARPDCPGCYGEWQERNGVRDSLIPSDTATLEPARQGVP